METQGNEPSSTEPSGGEVGLLDSAQVTDDSAAQPDTQNVVIAHKAEEPSTDEEPLERPDFWAVKATINADSLSTGTNDIDTITVPGVGLGDIVLGVSLGVDLTHDKLGGIDCFNLFQELKADKRVKYLIFQGKIWSVDRANEGDREYTGSNFFIVANS